MKITRRKAKSSRNLARGMWCADARSSASVTRLPRLETSIGGAAPSGRTILTVTLSVLAAAAALAPIVRAAVLRG